MPQLSKERHRPADRAPLREQVHHALVERILRGEVEPGERISDTALAGELGVSRTPIREALLRLEREGFLEADVGRGFFVKPLSAREVGEVYPILTELEALALRSQPAFPPDLVAALDRVNAELGRADGPDRRIELDVRWHRTLLEGCGNAFLLETIATLKTVTWRYEYAYMRCSGLVPLSTATHDAIARAVEAGDRAGAVRLLESNWRTGAEALLAWTSAREAAGGGDGKEAAWR